MSGSDFIVLSQGQLVSMTAPYSTAAFTPMNIAWSLSQINRFNGHALRPYSVAEHSLLVCEIAQRELGLDVHGLLAALMHDAHEIVTGDMHTPGKVAIGYPWRMWESHWQQSMRSAYAIQTASVAFAAQIQRADLIALATERRDLMPQSTVDWAVLHGIEPVTWVDLYTRERIGASWEDWRDRFLDRLHELDSARNHALYSTRMASVAQATENPSAS